MNESTMTVVTAEEVRKELADLLAVTAPTGKSWHFGTCSVELVEKEGLTEVAIFLDGKKQDLDRSYIWENGRERLMRLPSFELSGKYFRYHATSRKVFDFDFKRELPGYSVATVRFEKHKKPAEGAGRFIHITTSDNFPGSLYVSVGSYECSLAAPLY